MSSGEKATVQTHGRDVNEPERIFSVDMTRPAATSQSRKVSSPDADPSKLPSGEKATDQTQYVWPSNDFK